MCGIVLAVFVSLVASATLVNAQLVPIKISYATTSGIRLPLWIAAEAKLYEKYGLDAKLINIPSGNTAISALVTGEVDIVSGSGSSSIVAAGRGLPVVIVGSFGSTTYKLVANPGVTDLRGKTVRHEPHRQYYGFCSSPSAIETRINARQRREDSCDRDR